MSTTPTTPKNGNTRAPAPVVNAEVYQKQEMPAAAAPTRRVPKLNITKLVLAEFRRAIHFAEPEDGVTAKDMLEPSYWADVSNKLRALDRIEALAADGSWFAEFIVLNSGRLWAKVEMLRYIELKSNAEVSGGDPEFDVVWRNPHHKYGVMRRADKSLLKEDFQTKEEAARWLQEHLQSIAR